MAACTYNKGVEDKNNARRIKKTWLRCSAEKCQRQLGQKVETISTFLEPPSTLYKLYYNYYWIEKSQVTFSLETRVSVECPLYFYVLKFVSSLPYFLI